MSDFDEISAEADSDEVRKFLREVKMDEDFLEIPKVNRLNILRRVLQLTEKFLLSHRYKDSNTGSAVYIISEDDTKLFQIYMKISKDIGRLHYEEPERRSEIEEEIELMAKFILKTSGEDLKIYHTAIENKIKSSGLKD